VRVDVPVDTSGSSAPIPVLEVDLGNRVRAGFTTVGRHGDFNLSATVGDDTAQVAERRRRVEAWAGVPVIWVRQVHGATVHVHRGPAGAGRRPGRGSEAGGSALPEADAVVTVGTGAAAGVLVADCVPVLLADPARDVVAAVHAGRRGLAAGVLSAAVEAMERWGARRDHLAAVIGPAICGACYEVPASLQVEVDRAVPGTASTTSWGTPALDLPAGARAQLRAAGVRVDAVDACTATDGRFFSHRAAGAPGSVRPHGRCAGVVALVSEQ
jgi:polyphenol oxidase